MKIGYCRGCAMENKSQADKPSRRRIIVQITVDIIIWLTVSLPVLYLFLNGKPYQTGFFCDEISLSYPSKPSSVSTPLLIAAGFTLSVLLVVFVEVLNCLESNCRRPCQRVNDIMYCVKSYGVFLVGFLIEEMVVEVVKNKMGVLRPNFFDVCKPQFNRTVCPGYISEYTCTGNEDDKDLRSSRQSFPSGHAAFSMYIAAYFCIHIENRLQIRFSRLLKFFLQSGLIFLAILCGLGRIKDNKHHPSDVIAGFILGIVVAVFVYIVVWRKMLTPTTVRDTPSMNIIDKACECSCTCEQLRDLEPQTPAPLLQNEYFHTAENAKDSSSTKLISLQNDTRHHMFVPVTACKAENV